MKAYILLGGNIGDVRYYFQKSIESISASSTIIKKSSIVQSKAWGFESDDLFLNQVIEIDTNLPAEELLNSLHLIEKDLGRKRISNEYSSRTIDLDILYYGEAIMNNNELIIPHPRLHLRRFTLVPLAEIAPNYIHPTLLLSNQQLLEICQDNAIVQLA